MNAYILQHLYTCYILYRYKLQREPFRVRSKPHSLITRIVHPFDKCGLGSELYKENYRWQDWFVDLGFGDLFRASTNYTVKTALETIGHKIY